MWLDAAGFKGHIAAVTEEDVEPAEAHEAPKQRPEIRWGVGVSVLLHVPLIALLIFGLPKIEPKPAEDESVKVELVPPPEERKPEERKPEEKQPAPKPPEQAKKQPPPPPPPPPPPETAKSQPEAPSAPRTARPVLEFAEKDSAPEQMEKGLPQQAEAPKPPIADVKPEEAPVEPPQPQKSVIAEAMPAANPVPQDIELPQVETAEANPEKNGPAATGQDEAKTNFEQAKPRANSTTAPPSTPPDVKAKESNKLTKAKTLFTDKLVSDPTVKTAMNNLSRQKRGGKLCWSELREQLLHSSAGYNPNLIEVPLYDLPDGNFLTHRRGAFYDGKQLFNLAFNCEVNDNATKVVSFEFSVGNAIPKSEWARYHYP
ncbi:DUF930 domain-containing protein [Rhizobium binae]|uniref:DUF930 domain-containing protein n=1 Tax=Rhizobium binae TaxID=1138190 RepID=UPI001C83EC17|nr:DUF930 domain-containing protein [Rhizobium binae]MBX4941545.1 DUF930 domain-containing protein [Rhizobium binae]MBX4947560.1 DUF930 domain-containing protein [Rhizobium binae]MBX4965400.1 DUF930 domain-containing protein [Rhizobium binae]MBX4966423.1 DUF930 domain-containing protein [Rhizobium binae]MBX4983453.1 DUF930 domain-containing protein [Rhizobium binae]